MKLEEALIDGLTELRDAISAGVRLEERFAVRTVPPTPRFRPGSFVRTRSGVTGQVLPRTCVATGPHGRDGSGQYVVEFSRGRERWVAFYRDGELEFA